MVRTSVYGRPVTAVSCTISATVNRRCATRMPAAAAAAVNRTGRRAIRAASCAC